MDLFFQQTHKDFFAQFQQAALNVPIACDIELDEMIDDDDDQIYDRIEEKISERPRMVNELNFGSVNSAIPDVGKIIDMFKCPFCMEIVGEPIVIKHCLHFFCKNCIEQQIRGYKKECPLCKKSMGTHRELRQHKKLLQLLEIIRPSLIQYEEEVANNLGKVREIQQREQIDLKKLKDQQNQRSSKKRTLEMRDEDQMLDAEEKSDEESTLEEKSEQERIQKTVERLRQIQKEHQGRKLIMIQQSRNQDQEGLIVEGVNPDEVRFKAGYQELQQKWLDDSSAFGNFKVASTPPTLNLRVRLLFEEDFRTLVFPKVKEFLFKASSDTPLSIAAKALAFKNEEPHMWQYYTFSNLKRSLGGGQDHVMHQCDLQHAVGNFRESLSQDEVIFFYKITAPVQPESSNCYDPNLESLQAQREIGESTSNDIEGDPAEDEEMIKVSIGE